MHCQAQAGGETPGLKAFRILFLMDLMVFILSHLYMPFIYKIRMIRV